MRTFDTKAFEPAIGWARRHERQISALSLAGGFAFDSATFGRIDHAITQAVFIVYLLVAGIAIAVLHGLESRPDGRKLSDKTRTILVAITQFALGCLLSGFCVFYIRSASITSSWPFLLAMAAIFIGNEYLRRYHARLVFCGACCFSSPLYSYAILLVPVVIGQHRPHPLSYQRRLLRWRCSSFYMQALARLGHERYRGARRQIFIGMVLITLFLNLAYFAAAAAAAAIGADRCGGLSQRQTRRQPIFRRQQEDEPPEWQALFGTHAIMHVQKGAKLYLYNAVFAPRGLHTSIVHDWQWLQPGQGLGVAAAHPSVYRPVRSRGWLSLFHLQNRAADRASGRSISRLLTAGRWDACVLRSRSKLFHPLP